MTRRGTLVLAFSSLIALAFLLDTASTLRARDLGSESNPIVPSPQRDTRAYLASVGIRWLIATALLWGFLPRRQEPRVRPSAPRLLLTPFPYRLQIGHGVSLGLSLLVTLKLAAALSNALLVGGGAPLPLTLALAHESAWPGFLACWAAILAGAYLLSGVTLWSLWEGEDADLSAAAVDSPPPRSDDAAHG